MSAKTLRESVAISIFNKLWEEDNKEAESKEKKEPKFLHYDKTAHARAEKEIGKEAGRPDESDWRFAWYADEKKWKASKDGGKKIYDISKYPGTIKKLNAAFPDVVNPPAADKPADGEAPASEKPPQVAGGESGGLRDTVFTRKFAYGEKTKKFGGDMKTNLALSSLQSTHPKAYQALVKDEDPGGLSGGIFDDKKRKNADFIDQAYVHFTAPRLVTRDAILASDSVVDHVFFRIGRRGAGSVKDYRGSEDWAKELAADIIFGKVAAGIDGATIKPEPKPEAKK